MRVSPIQYCLQIIIKQEKPNVNCCNVNNWTIFTLLKNPAFVIYLINCFLHCLGAYTVFGFTSVSVFVVHFTH